MKKFLALVLALVMTMSLVTISAGAEDFTDDASITYEEAVDVMTAIGVVGGYADGSFNPTAGLTRGAAAKIICNMILGPTTAEALSANDAPFSDVAVDNVFAGYIAYCANEGIISGYADGTFKPAAPLTGYAFMKMLLGALGYDAVNEGYVGTNWSIAVAKRALAIELDDGLVSDFVGAKALTREEACLYAFNTLMAYMVDYENNSTITIGDVVISNSSKAAFVADDLNDYDSLAADKKVQFAEKYFEKLVDKTSVSVDAYGRPAHAWKYGKTDVGTYTDTPVLVYTEAFEKEDLVDALEELGYEIGTEAYAWVDGAASGTTSAATFTALADDYEFGGAGVVQEFYGYNNAAGDDVINKVVAIQTYIAEVDDKVSDKVSTKDDDRVISLAGVEDIAYEDEQIANFDEIFAGVEEEDFVLYTLDTAGKVETVVIPETIEGKVTKVASGKATIDGTVYAIAANGSASVGADAQTIWLDTYGNVMKTENVAAEDNYVYYVTNFNETDKWNTTKHYVQGVNTEGEIVELYVGKGAEGAAVISGLTGKIYKYTTNADGVATLTSGGAVLLSNGEIKTTTAKYDTYYFADDVSYIYIDGTAADLKASAADGVQKLTISASKQARVILNDDNEIKYVFVTGKVDNVNTEDLVFVAETQTATAAGTAINAEGDMGYTAKFYLNGEEMVEIISGLSLSGTTNAGFYTYEVEADTGAYKLTPETDTDAVAFDTVTVAQDKYITVGSVCEDFQLASDCDVYDLSKNEIDTLADLAKMLEEGLSLTAGVVFDKDDAVVTALYIVG